MLNFIAFNITSFGNLLAVIILRVKKSGHERAGCPQVGVFQVVTGPSDGSVHVILVTGNLLSITSFIVDMIVIQTSPASISWASNIFPCLSRDNKTKYHKKCQFCHLQIQSQTIGLFQRFALFIWTDRFLIQSLVRDSPIRCQCTLSVLTVQISLACVGHMYNSGPIYNSGWSN